MKKIGIFAQVWLQWDDSLMENEGLGGSETWIVEFSRFLGRQGYDVTVYSNPFREYITEDGIKYRFYKDYNGEKYDIAIISRICKNYFEINAEYKFCIAHDILPWDFTEEICNDKNFCGIGALSEWHKNYILEQYPFLDKNLVFMFNNGYNEELYKDVDYSKKENAMVWSSQPERGLYFIADKVIPLIKEKIPDFKVYFCFPNYVNDVEQYSEKGVVYKGSLTKYELSKLQKSCKIWVYPNLGRRTYDDFFFETFCITALENAMAGNAIVTNDGGGLSTTLEGYKFLDKYDSETIVKQDVYAKELADKAIEFLSNEDRINEARESLFNVCESKTWKNVNEKLLFNIRRLIYINKAHFIIFKENGKKYNDTMLDETIRLVKKNDSKFANISSSDINDTYFHSLNNVHHYTTNFHYHYVLPIICNILGIDPIDIDKDFYLIKNNRDEGDFSFLYPKEEHDFTVTYGKKYFLGENRIRLEITQMECLFNGLYGEQLNGRDFRNDTSYHRLYCLSHYTSKIENKGKNNGRTLLVSGNSHFIPLLPVLSCYYKKIIYLDNRDYISYRWLWKDDEPDDVLFVMGNSKIYDIDRYLDYNFR